MNVTTTWRTHQWCKCDFIFATADNSLTPFNTVIRGEGRQGGNISPGAESLRGASKSPNNVASTFYSAAHLLPKDFLFEHGSAKLASYPGRHLTSLRPRLWYVIQMVASFPRSLQPTKGMGPYSAKDAKLTEPNRAAQMLATNLLTENRMLKVFYLNYFWY